MNTTFHSTQGIERANLIVNVPCFATFTSEEINELASVMEDICYESGAIIVKQGDIVDSVYLIVDGQVEVNIEEIVDDQKKLKPICVLGKNDVIGLSKIGFFSTTGMRTATVKAITKVQLLSISLDNFYRFLKKFPASHQKMQNTAEEMLYMSFIKRAAPFACLTNETIKKLMQTIDKKTYAAHEVIFQQGVPADNCYLIVSGEIEIAIGSASDEKEFILSKLTSSELFGEQALLIDAPRSATARTTKPTVLLSISREQLINLFQNEAQTRKEILAMMMERQCPIQKSNVVVYQHTNSAGEVIITLKEPIQHNYYRLSPHGLFIWQQLDGMHSLQDITLAFFEEFKHFSPQSICGLVVQLAYAGLVELATLKIFKDQENMSLWQKSSVAVQHIMEAKVALKNADKTITRWYKAGIHWLFAWPFQIVFFLLSVGGMIAFFTFTTHAALLLKNIPHISLIFVYFLIADILAVPIHELAHAFTTKYFGKEVNQFGVGWFWWGPMAFADTSDMWLCTKWPRIIVNCAGLYVNMILAGIAAILAYLSSNPHISIFLWLYAAISYYEVIVNLNPTQELDGYYILMDILDKPNLQESSILWLVNDLPRSFKLPKLFFAHKAELTYWIATVLFLILIAYVAYLFQIYVIQHLFPQLTLIHYLFASQNISTQFENQLQGWSQWFLPVLAVALSGLSIFFRVKQKLLQIKKINVIKE